MSRTETPAFRDREDAAGRLADQLKDRSLWDPLVLAIPRGGVVTGAALARELGAELDVVLARKLRAPFRPEYVLGAVSEDARVTLNPDVREFDGITGEYLKPELRYQLAELERRKKMIRAVRPAARIDGRSVVVTDDGIATGSTMIAALRVMRNQDPHELIVAVPVASRARLDEIRRWCDATVCLLTPPDLRAIGPFYKDFSPVGDEEVVRLLRETPAAFAAGS